MSQAITTETITGLAEKLDALDLDLAERAALDALFARAAAAGDDVTGFGVVFEVETTDVKSGQPMGFNIGMPPTVTKLAGGLGLVLGDGNAVGDTRFRG